MYLFTKGMTLTEYIRKTSDQRCPQVEPWAGQCSLCCVCSLKKQMLRCLHFYSRPKATEAHSFYSPASRWGSISPFEHDSMHKNKMQKSVLYYINLTVFCFTNIFISGMFFCVFIQMDPFWLQVIRAYFWILFLLLISFWLQWSKTNKEDAWICFVWVTSLAKHCPHVCFSNLYSLRTWCQLQWAITSLICHMVYKNN